MALREAPPPGEACVLIPVPWATYRHIRGIACDTDVRIERLVDRLLEKGRNRWHEDRPRGALAGWSSEARGSPAASMI